MFIGRRKGFWKTRWGMIQRWKQEEIILERDRRKKKKKQQTEKHNPNQFKFPSIGDSFLIWFLRFCCVCYARGSNLWVDTVYFSRVGWQLAQMPGEIEWDFHFSSFHSLLLIFRRSTLGWFCGGDGEFAWGSHTFLFTSPTDHRHAFF